MSQPFVIEEVQPGLRYMHPGLWVIYKPGEAAHIWVQSSEADIDSFLEAACVAREWGDIHTLLEDFQIPVIPKPDDVEFVP